MFIPWQQLTSQGVVEVQGSDTVAQLRDRLSALGGREQHLSALVVHLSDGRIVPSVVSQVKELAKLHGRRILESKLEDLAEALCPDPWEVTDNSPEHRNAELLVQRRRFPVVIVAGGQRLGLIRQLGREIGIFRPRDDAFDLFDLSVPQPDRATFVWTRANATLAHLVRKLEPLRHVPLVYVVLLLSQDECAVTTKADLNGALERLAQEVNLPPEQFWALPVGQLKDALKPARVREVEELSGTQAEHLSKSQSLVLIQDGVPAILYPARMLSGGTSVSVVSDTNVDTVPIEELQEIPDFLADAEKPEADMPETRPRSVNVWFADNEGQDLDRGEPLVLRQQYQLRVNIGQPRREALTQGPAIREPTPETPEGSTLFVSLFSDDFDIPNPTQPLLLPPSGDSPTVEFALSPTRRTFGPDDKATLDVHIYYRCNLVQSWQIEVEVILPGQERQSGRPQASTLLATRTEDYTALEEIGPRHLSLTIDRAPDGSYRFDFVVAADEQADKVQLSARVHLRRQDLTHLITKARRQLYNITRAREYQKAVEVDTATRKKALGALALLGRQLYSHLFEIGGPRSSARQLGVWIKDNLPEGSVFQIIDRAHDFVFPWSLVYDEVPWDENGLYEQVDLNGFWGWRYKVELLTERLLETYKTYGVEIEAREGLKVGVGLNEKIAWGEDQRGFFDSLRGDSGDRAQYTIFDSSPELTEFLQKGNQHVLYVFCHGFTERMATDIQIGDDLLGEFKAWLRSLPTEERSALRLKELETDALFNVSDSWIKLTFGEVPLTMMEYYASPHLEDAPLVFLNMCESAQVLPSLSGGFIPFFLQRGARGIIGTECPMTSTFAHPFSQEFFRRFLEGQPVGQILWELRREFLEKGNPLGLAYTLYCDANMRLKEAIFGQ